MKKCKVGIVVGRFQIFHEEHHEHILRALEENDVVCVFVGSANKRKSLKNPFNSHQRAHLVYENMMTYANELDTYLFVSELNDITDNVAWAEQIKNKIATLEGEHTDREITMYGCDKGGEYSYLEQFPEYTHSYTNEMSDVSSTELRDLWFLGKQTNVFLNSSTFLSEATLKWLSKMEYDQNLQEDWEFYNKEKALFANYPFPETLSFSCGDAVILVRNKVLMIRRKFAPGKGCMALPGGFKNRNETFMQCVVREMYEETGIEIDEATMMTYLIGVKLFDDPNRSQGIPRATLAGYFDLTPMYPEWGFPTVNAGDDAAEVSWVTIGEGYDNVYDDHIQIVEAAEGFREDMLV